VDREAVALTVGSSRKRSSLTVGSSRKRSSLRVLAHFVPGEKVSEFLAPETDLLDIRYCGEDDDDTFYRELPEAEVIWHVLRPISGPDLEQARRCDVVLMLAALRRLLALDRATREGKGWPSDPSLGETVRDIGGCTVGLVGYGTIATTVEKIVVAMGAPPSKVLHTSTRDDGHPGWRSLPDLLAASDIVSLHLPLTEKTAGMLDRAAIARMKPDAVLVNTSRGGVVDEDALVDALCTGGLAAAGLDVFAVEPIPADNPLLGLDNVVLTPHVTWYTVDTMRRYLKHAVDNCRRIADGRELANVVNR